MSSKRSSLQQQLRQRNRRRYYRQVRTRFGSIQRLKLLLLDKTNGHCYYCGCVLLLETVTVDHLIPTSKGGPTRLLNLVPACSECNQKKADRTLVAIGYNQPRNPEENQDV